MRCVTRCPVGCPFAWTGTPGIGSRCGGFPQIEPATLLLSPTVGPYRWPCELSGFSYLSALLSDPGWAQRGGTIACPLARRPCVRPPRPLLPSPLPLPSNVGGDPVHLRPVSDGGAR